MGIHQQITGNVNLYSSLYVTIPSLWYPKENFTKLPSLVILVVPDSVEQLMAYSNLESKQNF